MYLKDFCSTLNGSCRIKKREKVCLCHLLTRFLPDAFMRPILVPHFYNTETQAPVQWTQVCPCPPTFPPTNAIRAAHFLLGQEVGRSASWGRP